MSPLVLAPIVGALFRRWWGGWSGWKPHWFSIPATYVVPFGVAMLEHPWPVSAISAAILGTSFINPFYILRHNVDTWMNVAKMSGYWTLVCGALAVVLGHWQPVMMGPGPVAGYLTAWLLQKHLPQLGSFANGYTTYGELVTGAAIYSTLMW